MNKIPKNKNRKKHRNKMTPWKRFFSLSMALLLVMTVIFSTHLSGVLAEEDLFTSEPVEETAESQEDLVQFNPSEETETISDTLNENAQEPQNDAEPSADENVSLDEQPDEENPEITSIEEISMNEETEPDTNEFSIAEENSDEEVTEVFSDGGDDATETFSAGTEVLETVTAVTESGQNLNISTTQGDKESLYNGTKNVVFDYDITLSAEETAGLEQNVTLTVSDCGIMSDDDSLEIWHVADEGVLVQIPTVQIAESKVVFQSTELGEYFAVSDVISVDLAKNDVTITANTFSGMRQDGKTVQVVFLENSEKKYRISQSDNGTRVGNQIRFSGSENYTVNRNIILDGINTSNWIDIPAKKVTVLATLQLRGTNQVHHIYYGTGTHGSRNEENSNNNNSRLTIENYGDVNGTTGELYIPWKMNSEDEELQYVNTKVSSGIGQYWSLAGIGGGSSGSLNNSTGLTIAGGKIRVLGQNSNGATAIGGGGNGDGQVSITGGNITAICSCTGSAIGGGIGWINRGGTADVSITGGIVYAENVGYYTRDGISYGGVAIGSGSSMNWDGSEATINIGGNSYVTAYARYGNGIGSGNSLQKSAANTTINISGNSQVTTNALGGGTSKENKGGSATIAVSDSAIVNCIEYSQIEDKWDENIDNILGAFGIGGGNSAGDSDGGSAIVNVSGGILNCSDGNIGGGNANGSGNGGAAIINVSNGTLNCERGTIGGGSADTGSGGDASVYVTGGNLDCASVGGGNSVSGTPGAVTDTTNTRLAGVVVTGGTVKAGTIGGGTNIQNDIGFATANISGGIIQGQFILANTDESQKCTFTMTGGTIDNTDLGKEGYPKAQANGGAVYLSDPNGEVSISGNTSIIQNCNATEGGAIYLSGENGKVNISGGTIKNCTAAEGGAVYMTAGTFDFSGGSIGYNEASQNGAGIYMAGGSMNVSGGSIEHNKATKNGGGAYLQEGNLEINGGFVTNNTATENGGGAYLSGGQLLVNGGTVSSNNAVNGGGSYLSDGQLMINSGSVSGNTATEGAGAYVADGTVRMFGGEITGNRAKKDGGGMYVSSDNQAADVVVRSGKLSNNMAGEDGDTASPGNGGAIAVVNNGTENRADQIIIGVCELHTELNTVTRAFKAFDYSDEKDGSNSHHHDSCPIMEKNRATGNGGGIYMGSTAAQLHIYCLTEVDNKSDTDSAGDGVMANGGTVTIGDIEANNEGNEPANARGNIRIASSMLVSGGKIDIYGNMENPYFVGEILVKIQQDADKKNNYFLDHRKSISTKDKEYKIHYFENFNDSGTYKAKQYDETAAIKAEGSLFDHKDEGYRILEWNTEADGTGKSYNIGSVIGNAEDHSAWGTTDEAQDSELILYAIWVKIEYTVVYNSNVSAGTEYSGTMKEQVFQYGETQSLTPNAYKVTGMRFSGWNTEKDGTGTAYAADYSESKMTTTHGATVTLYAQWVTCTHKEGTEYPGQITYTADDNADTITEICDCGAHTETVTLKAATVYYDGNEHPATVTKSSEAFYAAVSEVRYQYRKADSDQYNTMLEGESIPKSVGHYKATITAGDHTVSVEYEIKSQSEGASIDAIAAKGQKFSAFNEEKNVSISNDDAFTVQFSARQLNTDYTTVPALNVSPAFPDGTTIIMQTNGKYYWEKIEENSSTTEIGLNSFKEMGTENTKFDYEEVKSQVNQTYRFIVDFSKVKAGYSAGDLNCGLTYDYTDKPLTGSVNIGIANAESFGLTVKTGGIIIDAPQMQFYNRWNNKSLVLELSSTDKTLPGDISLTVTAGDKNQQYWPDSNGDFVIPLTWATSQDVNLTLNSDVADAKGKAYLFQAKLYAGAKDGQTLVAAGEMDTGVTLAGLSLTVAKDTSPSLKITDKTGTHRLLTKSDSTLDLDVEWENIDKNCTVNANIQKKTAQGYDGVLLQTTVTQGENKFSLGGIQGSGSYRLVITVTKDQRTIMTIPYYFIVQ